MTLHTRGGGVVRHSAVTWLSQEKAIALAVEAHLRRHPDDDAIYDVEVEGLGPVARDAEGTIVLERTDLSDRFEF